MKPITMSAEEEATIRNADEKIGPWVYAIGAADRRMLLREIDALRARLAKADDVVARARTLGSYDWGDCLEDSRVSDDARHDARELSIAVFLYDEHRRQS